MELVIPVLPKGDYKNYLRGHTRKYCLNSPLFSSFGSLLNPPHQLYFLYFQLKKQHNTLFLSFKKSCNAQAQLSQFPQRAYKSFSVCTSVSVSIALLLPLDLSALDLTHSWDFTLWSYLFSCIHPHSSSLYWLSACNFFLYSIFSFNTTLIFLFSF